MEKVLMYKYSVNDIYGFKYTHLFIEINSHISFSLQPLGAIVKIPFAKRNRGYTVLLGLNVVKSKATGRKPDDPIQPNWYLASGINCGDKQHQVTMTYVICLTLILVSGLVSFVLNSRAVFNKGLVWLKQN